MKKLSEDWFLEGMLDFEYKKYVLLAYLGEVSRKFAEYKLYPAFSDLIFHYNNLHQFRENRQQIRQRFPSHLDQEELRNLRLRYTSEVEEGGDLEEISSIVEYALPNIQSQLKAGKEIYEAVNQQLVIEPIGITPLYKREGYILLQINPLREIKAYFYRVAFFENVEANYYGISFDYRNSFTYSLSNTFENMKRELIRTCSDLPNPATFLLHSRRLFPEAESILPIAKRKMLSYLK